jgi:hypothetical protein
LSGIASAAGLFDARSASSTSSAASAWSAASSALGERRCAECQNHHRNENELEPHREPPPRN